MPFTPEMRRKVDQIRDYLYGGGYPDPLSNAEQLSFLFFFYMIEGIDAANVRQARATGRDYASLFTGDWTLRNSLNAPSKGVETIPRERMRWSSWANALSGEGLVIFVRDEVFPFFAGVGDAYGMSFMAQARLSVDEPTVLTQIVTLVNELRLEGADPDTKGDLFEHVLRQIKQAGELGQFRTPRHIIRAIVDLVDPKIGETVYDPAAGTAGFLVAAYEHIRLANSSNNGREVAELEGKTFERGLGDRLSAAQWRRLQTGTFYGNDVDPKMVSLASMNLALRGLPDVRILKRNVLTTSFDRQAKAERRLPLNGYDVILANPPFSGRLDRDRIVDDVKIGTSTATELLFVKYMIDSLRLGGRCGVVVPEGVLFGSTGAHKELRRILMQNNRVEAVLSLPGGVFQPYSGVKTSVLVFAAGGRTERVMFLHASNDGFKLDANHDQPIEADDLPGLIAAFNSREEMWEDWQARDPTSPWVENWWFSDAAAIEHEDWNLSVSRYRPESREAAEHRNPRELLQELEEDVQAVLGDIQALAAELRGEAA
ncbi:type I restriction-modification system subunit M [Methylobacterium sp. J-059]|uniref:HsdM family class I SAM-dependent methyltransferase n=1 Tax=Methylobacterium sp. J-059 TaxID=2836643 RepID=UPI001FB87638|nr:class I SAM-dependent DNA methyltransferase [Methylobacterium sp. J-059]MCJ2042527.1 type I restriction-modification system subunit M [Methylobacterium sp. J-059]